MWLPFFTDVDTRGNLAWRAGEGEGREGKSERGGKRKVIGEVRGGQGRGGEERGERVEYSIFTCCHEHAVYNTVTFISYPLRLIPTARMTKSSVSTSRNLSSTSCTRETTQFT